MKFSVKLSSNNSCRICKCNSSSNFNRYNNYSSSCNSRACNKYNPVSGAPCNGNPLKPNHYNDCPSKIAENGTATIFFDADTQYIAFVNGKIELDELWAAKSTPAWPSSYTVQKKALAAPQHNNNNNNNNKGTLVGDQCSGCAASPYNAPTCGCGCAGYKAAACCCKGGLPKPCIACTNTEWCFHTEDAPNHKCYDGCATSTFQNKGLSLPGKCPPNYSVVESETVVEQCNDGVTNLKWCADGNKVNVTMDVKGEGLLQSANVHRLH